MKNFVERLDSPIEDLNYTHALNKYLNHISAKANDFLNRGWYIAAERLLRSCLSLAEFHSLEFYETTTCFKNNLARAIAEPAFLLPDSPHRTAVLCEACGIYEDILDLAPVSHPRIQQSRALVECNIGLVKTYLGRFVEAKHHLRRARADGKSIDKARALSGLGVLCHVKFLNLGVISDLDKALRYYTCAVDEFRSLEQDHKGQSDHSQLVLWTYGAIVNLSFSRLLKVETELEENQSSFHHVYELQAICVDLRQALNGLQVPSAHLCQIRDSLVIAEALHSSLIGSEE